MKLPKKLPKISVRVYPSGKDEYKMVIMEPRELATFRQEGTKWVTEDGIKHRTHRDAMHHVAKQMKDRELLKALPSPVKSPRREEVAVAQPNISFKTTDEAIEFVLQQPGIVQYLLKALDKHTAPKTKKEVRDAVDQAM